MSTLTSYTHLYCAKMLNLAGILHFTWVRQHPGVAGLTEQEAPRNAHRTFTIKICIQLCFMWVSLGSDNAWWRPVEVGRVEWVRWVLAFRFTSVTNAMLEEHSLHIRYIFSIHVKILHFKNCLQVVNNVDELLSIGSCETISLLAHL